MGKIQVNPDELADIQTFLKKAVTQLEVAYKAAEKLERIDFYEAGDAMGQIGMYPVLRQHVAGLLGHYQRVDEYVKFTGETFVELDESLARGIEEPGKKVPGGRIL